MKDYTRKNQNVKAIQWIKHGDHGKVIRNGEGDHKVMWHYDGCCTLCEKYAADSHGYIETIHGGLIICPGTWIIERSDGIQTYSDKEFKERYEVSNVS